MSTEREVPVVAIDFDGVLHSYVSGWTGEVPRDLPEDGALSFVEDVLAMGNVSIVVFSTRASTRVGRKAIEKWLTTYGFPRMMVTAEKVRATIYIDDRAARYRGNWNELRQLVKREIGSPGIRAGAQLASESAGEVGYPVDLVASHPESYIREFADPEQFVAEFSALRNICRTVEYVEWRFRWWPGWRVDVPSLYIGDTERWVEGDRYSLSPVMHEPLSGQLHAAGVERYMDGWRVWGKALSGVPLAILVDAMAISVFGARSPRSRPEGVPGGPGYVSQPVPYSAPNPNTSGPSHRAFSPCGLVRETIGAPQTLTRSRWDALVECSTRTHEGKDTFGQLIGPPAAGMSVLSELSRMRSAPYVELPESAGASEAGLGLMSALDQMGIPWYVQGIERHTECRCLREDMMDPLKRELHSLRYRRSAMTKAFDVEQAARNSAIVVATKRPQQAEHLVSMLERQRTRVNQVVLACHGWDIGQLDLATRQRLVALPSKCISVPSDALLGDVLNAGVEATQESLVIRLDDDDIYSEWYVHDLLLAHLYSGADLVGTSSEWVYLESADVTLQLPYADVERFSSQTSTGLVGGGRMLFTKQIWEAVAGFRSIGFFEDGELSSSVRLVGGSVYRSHGLNTVYFRHAGEGNTYREEEGKFWAASVCTRDKLVEPFTLGCLS